VVRNISDTARWAAVFRARETERQDALFRDPYAARLAGTLGVEIANTLPEGNRHAWAWVARTFLFDQFIEREIVAGADMVVNIAAGLDARPYRMRLPPELQWVEIDLPEILEYKTGILREEKPVCRLQRLALDLADVGARRIVLQRVAEQARKILVLTEGLIIYLEKTQVISLAQDLAAHAQFQRWVADLHSPGLLRMMQRTTGKHLSQVGAPFKFGPAEGPPFFERWGWKVEEVRGLLKTAGRHRRLPLALKLFSYLPESKDAQGSRPWSGVCLYGRKVH
jgi:methyltransferase (TIGR00027 family)